MNPSPPDTHSQTVSLANAEAQPIFLGRYQLFDELASGGMATVYLARAQGPAGFEKVVALKRIHPHLAKQDSFVGMFLDEARVAAQIDHPNVCSVFDVGAEGNAYFLAMEYLLGEPMRSLVRHPELKKETDGARCRFLARVVADTCRGLHAAHELRGPEGTPLRVVHRDVSPQNLFVTFHGQAKVVDFGIARAVGRLTTTDTGTTKGKPAYMAPEQTISRDVDRRVDVWAVGVVLWEMLTGRSLFRRETPQLTMMAVQRDPIVPPSSLRADVPAELDAIVLDALKRNPEERIPTAQELGRRLHEFANAAAPCGTAEVAEWMQTLFPAERQRKEAQLTRVRRTRPSSASGGHSGPLAPATMEHSLSRPGDTPPSTNHTPGRRHWWVLALAVLGATLGAVVARQQSPAALQAERPPVQAPLQVPTTAAAMPVVAPAPPPAPPPQLAPPEAAPVAPAPLGEPRTAAKSVADRKAQARRRLVRKQRREARRKAASTDRAQATAATESAAPGKVNLLVLGGWADVYLGERRLGRSPLSTQLPAGDHVLELRHPDRPEPRRVKVHVQPGAIVRKVVRM